MRALLAFLLAPVAGLAVFTLVWAAPEIQLARGDAHLAVAPGRLTPVWLLPAYLLILILSVPVLRELRTVFGWTGVSVAAGALVVYGATALGLSVAMGGLASLLPAWPQWVGLFCGALVHTAVFLSFRPGERKYYFH